MRDIKYRDDGRPEDLLQELGYETQDIAYRRFSVYGAYFFGFFIFCALAGFGIMYLLVPTKLSGGRMGDYIPKTEVPVGAPLLQTNITARTDIMSLRRKEAEALETPKVLDKSKGIYRIPIDQSIEDVVDGKAQGVQGLPTSAPDDKIAIDMRGRQMAPANTNSATVPSNVDRGESKPRTPPTGGNGG